MICFVVFIGMAKSVIFLLSDTICRHFFYGEGCIYSPRGMLGQFLTVR